MLPEGWRKKSFGDVVYIANGLVDPREASFKNTKHIGPENVISDTGRIVNERTCGDLKLISGKYEFDKHSIVYSKIRPNLNKVCTPSYSGVCSADMYVLHPRKGIDKNFLFFSILGDTFKNRAISMSMRTGMPKINREDLSSIPILLPPLPEQKKIAAILSTWDRAIEGTEKLLANSQQQKKALMQQLLTGKKRLPGFTGEWRNLKLKTFLQESVIPSPQPDPKKRITVRLNLNGVEKREVRGTESIDATNYFTRKAGQFIYGKQNIHKGAFGIIPKILDGFETSQDIPCFDFLPNVCPAWFFYYFARENIHHTLETKMTGTGSKRLNQKTFLNLTCHAPPISEQQAIAAVLTTADAEITALESDLSRLRQEKKALMQQLLTGKRRVTVD